MRVSDLYSKVYSFCNKCKRNYIYGNGHYGKQMTAFLKDSQIDIAGVIVTTDDGIESDADIIVAESMLSVLSKQDGVTVALLHGNLSTSMYQKYRRITNCLTLQDWEQDEIGKYEYHKRIAAIGK